MIEKVRGPKNLKRPLVFAHRGASGEYPENTRIAFKKAISSRADLIELDVTLSADRKVVVIHDDDLDRTTRLVGNVRDFESEILRELDAGSWFSRKFKKETIPFLKDVLDMIRKSETDLNVEIKSTAMDDVVSGNSIESLVLDLIRRVELRKRILISSFSWKCLERIRTIDPEIKLGVLVGEESGSVDEAIGFAEKVGAWSVHPSVSEASKENLEKISAKNLLGVVYTVNETADMRTFLDRGADGLFTNFPDRMRKLLRKEY
ncbi:glycerophosphodiester phosphodiesterase [Leptospira gomenensis]|uniref:Glycerophosphodiester phosphodiesterase n=1 Tax=Leptospira gomenensis TaxID=2484974 RepID=A0A5F1Y956_9LEPT|nr:glycerophosphodiester phosphodiesterase [Leptospira gomenensis]TGK32642.1 glycerophosphodiester phosphodiesterase [Leptospira gomenensis]TGK36790.1 glycerophosphodiester phosphodiesterase [Leptospira gomenensis]TGK48804.1 glycerophosphodiester phosphodiesterase [Leptospira gomenensis]TGK64570.1 glycerophosphodiester phosphodiesterase [Leptospira gomenensis]